MCWNVPYELFLSLRDLRSNIMHKLLVPLVALFLVSMTGCCSMFGLCASASVHTSIASPHTYAQQDKLQGAADPLTIAQVQGQPSTCSD